MEINGHRIDSIEICDVCNYGNLSLDGVRMARSMRACKCESKHGLKHTDYIVCTNIQTKWHSCVSVDEQKARYQYTVRMGGKAASIVRLCACVT